MCIWPWWTCQAAAGSTLMPPGHEQKQRVWSQSCLNRVCVPEAKHPTSPRILAIFFVLSYRRTTVESIWWRLRWAHSWCCSSVHRDSGIGMAFPKFSFLCSSPVIPNYMTVNAIFLKRHIVFLNFGNQVFFNSILTWWLEQEKKNVQKWKMSRLWMPPLHTRFYSFIHIFPTTLGFVGSYTWFIFSLRNCILIKISHTTLNEKLTFLKFSTDVLKTVSKLRGETAICPWPWESHTSHSSCDLVFQDDENNTLEGT